MSGVAHGASSTQGGARPSGAGVIRVMLVDDSAVIRGLVTRALESDPEIQVVASVSDGQMAVNTVKRQTIDVAVVDIEMPVMDGLTALPLLLQASPGLQVIIASTLTRKNAEISLKALRAGARDYVTKPSSTGELTNAQGFQQELIAKVRALAGPRRSPRSDIGGRPAPAHAPAPGAAGEAHAPERHSLHPRLVKGGPIALRAGAIEVPEVLAIGSSTGGPQALFTVLGGLRPDLRQPILITQHMPATFTTILAEHLARVTNRPCQEGKDGEAIQPGHVYVAPGDFHMIVEAQGAQRVLRLTKSPPENFCRPSVDPMLRSLAAIYGRRLLVTILTGMGQDGLRGSEAVVAAGGAIIAQDEATSVVWGMPGAVSAAGICHAVLPVGEIAGFITRHAGRGAP